MRILVLQYDNRGEVFPILSQLNRNSGFAHIFLTTSEFHVPPWWQKVFLVDKYLPEYDAVIWVDSDAAIVNPSNLPELDADFIYSPDSYRTPSQFNAGVWIVKNTPIGREIMKDWKNSYKPDRWSCDGQRAPQEIAPDWTVSSESFSNGKWKAKGMWAGKDYEQGAFVRKIIPKYRNSVKCLSWRIFQVFKREQAISSTFSVHFAGYRKKYLNTTGKKENVVG